MPFNGIEIHIKFLLNKEPLFMLLDCQGGDLVDSLAEERAVVADVED
jgi:hypothetical protein